MEDPFAESPKDLADLERRFTEAVKRLQSQHIAEVQQLQAQHGQAIADLTEQYERLRNALAASAPLQKKSRWEFPGEYPRGSGFPPEN